RKTPQKVHISLFSLQFEQSVNSSAMFQAEATSTSSKSSSEASTAATTAPATPSLELPAMFVPTGYPPMSLPPSTNSTAVTGSHTHTPLEANWTFKQADADDREFRSVAQFPTNVHLDLLHHKLIPDPFF